MARQPMNPEPWIKHMEAYTNFGGGLNTSTSNDNLNVNELVQLVNRDLSERGSSTRRTGFSKHIDTPVGAGGKSQGFFRYFRADGTVDDIQAVGGQLYKGNAHLQISGLAGGFQTDRFIEAVQYEDKMYFATGTRFVEYDGTTAKVVTPYTPKPLEALYVGLNGLADNPETYMQDGTATNLRIDTVLVDKRYGVVNEQTNFTFITSSPGGSTIEYKVEYKKESEETWTVLADFGTATKTTGFIPKEAVSYNMRFSVRLQGTTAEEIFMMPTYTVKVTDENQTVSVASIHTCNRILLHWDRIILYGDTTQTQAIFISHLKNPAYVPINNSLEFKNAQQEGLTALVRFRDMIVAFSRSSIQALYGKSPTDFNRISIHTGLGCVAPKSAAVMGNYITFLSEEGLYALVSVGTSEQRLNVRRLDDNIKNLITSDTDAIGVTFENQYQLTYPSRKERFRYYYEQGVWVKDESEKMDFASVSIYRGEMFAQSALYGVTYLFDDSVYTDDGYVYEDIIETKAFDFNAPYNPKKLKELQILLAHQGSDISMYCYVYADGQLIVNPDSDSSYASVNEKGNTVWNTVQIPNVESDVGTIFGSWVFGRSMWGSQQLYVAKMGISGSKCLRTSIKLVNKEPVANRFLGLAYVFKLKKP